MAERTLTYLLVGILALFLIGGSGLGVGAGISVNTAVETIGFFLIVNIALAIIAFVIGLLGALLPIIAIALAVYAGGKLLKQTNVGSTVASQWMAQPMVYQGLIIALLALLIL